MKTIVTIAEKGGVGKTTVASVMAAGLAKAGHRTLLIGLDVQLASAAVFLSSPPSQSSSAALLLGQSPTPEQGHLGVAVLAGGPALDGADIRSLHPDEMRMALAPLATTYDAVVVDVAPVLLHLHRIALDAADIALVITDAQSTESITGLAKVMREIQVALERGRHAPSLTIPVVNKVNRRLALDSQLSDHVHKKYGEHTIVEIPSTTVIPRAIAKKRPELALTEDSPARGPFNELLRIITTSMKSAKKDAPHG